MKLIIFEGISGSGKTTLFHPVHNLSNYGDLQIHRFTPTHWVHDRLNKRRENNYEILNRNIQSLIDTYVVWCDCLPEVAFQRQQSKKDPMIEDLIQARELFYKYFLKVSTWDKVILLRTDLFSIDECLQKINDYIYKKN